MRAFSPIFQGQRAAFSLIELLIALALITGLIVASVTAYSALTQSTALNVAGQQLAQIFEEAREDSVTKNLTIELRLYDIPPQAGTPVSYCAVGVYALNGNGSTTALTSPYVLPSGLVMDSSAERSPLLALNPLAATPDATDHRLNTQTRVVHFLADGATDLPTGSKWFVTVRVGGAADPTPFPSNWACVQIDPNTGHIGLYRP